ncbi:MAG: hypothetical protein KatS3mg019_2339 [Fimbriimonadales bacterium]|nr:MAG: hypothetical protein KatS3mg019_2339 [Fimbriimonadales bacterium]
MRGVKGRGWTLSSGHKWRRIALVIGFVAALAAGGWWYLQPPAPPRVAMRVMEAIRKKDGRTLLDYMCAEERERMTPEQLQHILDTIAQRFPELMASSHVPVAYRPHTTLVPQDYNFFFYFRLSPDKNELIACSSEEVNSLSKRYGVLGRMPEGYVRLSVAVSSLGKPRSRCALVMQALVLCVLRLSIAKNLSEQEIYSIIDEIFIKNGVQTVLVSSHTGTRDRLDKIKLVRRSDGRLGFEW